MSKKKTKDSQPPPQLERVPVSGKEYYAMCDLYGVVSELAKSEVILEKRARLIPGGWRDYRLIVVLTNKLMTNMLRTVPQKKLDQITLDLRHIHAVVKVTPDATGRKVDRCCYVPDDPLVRTIERIIKWECTFCEKSGAAVKQCEVRKDMEALYPWDFPEKCDGCIFQGVTGLD